mgnify:CR=1 FL=1
MFVCTLSLLLVCLLKHKPNLYFKELVSKHELPSVGFFELLDFVVD